MTVHFEYVPTQTIAPREASRRKKFPPKRDLKTFPKLGGWMKVDAIATLDFSTMSDEGFAAVAERLKGRSRYVKRDDYASVGSWLAGHALRILNEDAARPPRELTLAEIENWAPRDEQLAWSLYEKVVDLMPSDWIYSHDIDKEMLAASRFALDVWASDFMSKLSSAGRKGGQLSHRGATFTIEDLESVAGMSKSIQARILGCSVATISRLRRQRAYKTQGARS